MTAGTAKETYYRRKRDLLYGRETCYRRKRDLYGTKTYDRKYNTAEKPKKRPIRNKDRKRDLYGTKTYDRKYNTAEKPIIDGNETS